MDISRTVWCQEEFLLGILTCWVCFQLVWFSLGFLSGRRASHLLMLFSSPARFIC